MILFQPHGWRRIFFAHVLLTRVCFVTANITRPIRQGHFSAEIQQKREEESTRLSEQDYREHLPPLSRQPDS